jgi:hypothetical protein
MFQRAILTCVACGGGDCAAPWGVPAALTAGWLAWPALTPAYKEEVLGIKPAAAPAVAAAATPSSTPVFRTGGKYKYVRSEIGAIPTPEEE